MACPLASNLPILLVDDDEITCNMMRLTLAEAGVGNVQSISDSRLVLPFLQQQGAALVLLDLIMPHRSGQELLKDIRHESPATQVVVISGANELNLAVECMKLGAFDYLSKPVEVNRLIACVINALRLHTMQGELCSLKKRLLENSLEHPEAFEAIKTRSSKMRSLFQYAEVVARSPLPILITGETGVGKELMARAIHHLSGTGGELVSINVAGLDDATFSDTLFGHKKGAFTGADQAREGLITRASGGTLFLDEIGDLEERSQIKLLRLVQEGEYYPVGSDTLKKTTTHIIAATNHNLPELVTAKMFRRDLYYRLCSHEIHIPPLRERPEDIPVLLEHYLREATQAYRKNLPKVSTGAVSHLMGLSFPGNVRELKSILYDAVARHTEGELTARSFGSHNGCMDVTLSCDPNGPTIDALFGHFPTFHETEEYLIDEALRRTSGNLNLAAAMLGITRQTIANHRKKSNGTVGKHEKADPAPMEDLFKM